MKTKLIGVIVLIITSSQVFAQTDSYNFTLQEAIEYAMTNQNAIKNAELDRQISVSKVKETYAIGLPQVTGKASVQKNFDIPTQVLPDFISPAVYGVLMENTVRDGNGNLITMPSEFGSIPAQFGTTYNMSYGLEVSQLLFDGNYLLGLKAANVYKDLTVKALKRTKIETSIAVTKAYYSVLVTEKGIELLDANIIRLKKTLDDTKAYYDNGFAEKVDADRLTVIYNNLITERQNLQRVYELTFNLLKFQIGMSTTSDLKLKDKLDNVMMQEVNTSETINVESRVEYQLMKTQMRLMELDYKRNNVSRAPTLVAFGAFSKNAQNNDFSALTDKFFPTSIVGINLTVPIIGSGKKWQQANQAKLALKKTENDMGNLQNALTLESKSALTTYNNNVGQLQNQTKNMELATEVLRVSKAKYDQGVGSSLEVVTAETAKKEAENNYISALYNALIAKVELDKAYGRIQ